MIDNSSDDEPYTGAELRRFKRIGAGLETVGRSYMQQAFLEDKILKLVIRRENLKSRRDVISLWIVAAVNEAIGDLGVGLRLSYPRIQTKEN
jgi:hypothetical protein